MSIVRTAILLVFVVVFAVPACSNDDPQSVKKKVYALEQVTASK